VKTKIAKLVSPKGINIMMATTKPTTNPKIPPKIPPVKIAANRGAIWTNKPQHTITMHSQQPKYT
jgi:hypothetical protein